MAEDTNIELQPDDQVDVPVHFSLGDTSLPLNQLQSLQPGFIFPLDALPEKPVSVSVNGALIGRGEPVLVEGRLAIHLVEVTDHGS